MDYVLLLIIILPVVLCYFWYVSLITKRNKAREALSGIDVQLQQRSSVIPNILKIAKSFMDHEKSLLEEITRLRTQMDKPYDRKDAEAVKEHLSAAQLLDSKMGQLMISVEDYPDLKSDQTMIKAMQSYNEIEAQISAARRFYNAAVTSLNNAVEIFPGNMIASMAGVNAMPFYETDEAAKQEIDAAQFLNPASA
jgi:LemA protein